MPAPKRVVRIAHAYGNSRPALARALAADCDMIEVDMWTAPARSVSTTSAG